MKKLFAVVILLCSPAAHAQHAVDVTVAANGCPAAVANDGLDDLPAIQCQINYLDTNSAAIVDGHPAHTWWSGAVLP